MSNGIVAFEMTVRQLEGKCKLSQNRSQADQRRVACSPLETADPTVSAVGKAMRPNLEPGR